jgi:predicted transcriptional regulator
MLQKKINMKIIFQSSSYLVLLGISSSYGFLAKPAEMGLAILAGSLGLAFSNIDKISNFLFKSPGFNMELDMVKTIIENQTEPTPEQKEEAKNSKNITEIENQILQSLQKTGYTWRYAKTVASEISSPKAKTQETLAKLLSQGLAKKGKGSNGEIWAITILGKNVQEQHEINNE